MDDFLSCCFTCILACIVFIRLVLCVCFFFFKQKTAYEMRISDWSSDVCSSDLDPTQPFAGKIALVTGAARPRGIGRATALRLAQGGADVACLDIARQIGRASCRERVCQYV